MRHSRNGVSFCYALRSRGRKKGTSMAFRGIIGEQKRHKKYLCS
nr:MAG TPA: hypothetical protein [Microviridae sp.]